MRLPRMTTRRWMVAVVIAGLLIWSGQAVARWRHYRGRAEYHAAELANLNRYLIPALQFQEEYGRFPGCALTRGAFEEWQMESRRHERLKAKYQSAARYPWLLVDPDPPEPE